MATLCDYCSALAEGLSALSPAGFELEDSLLPIDYQTFASTVYYYHPSASELLDPALDCALCSCVSRAVEQYRSQYGQLDTTDDDPVIIRVKGRYLRPGEFKVLSCLIQTLNTDAFCIQCSLYCDAGEQFHTFPYLPANGALLSGFFSSLVALPLLPFSDRKRQLAFYVDSEILLISLRLVP